MNPVVTACTPGGEPCPLAHPAGRTAARTHPAGHAGTECRASAGECDPAEQCNGTSTTCPADAKKPVGTACTADGETCTLDQCDGASAACTHRAGHPGTQCRASAGERDPAALPMP